MDSFGNDDTDIHICFLIGSYLSQFILPIYLSYLSRSYHVTVFQEKTTASTLTTSGESGMDNELQTLLTLLSLLLNSATSYMCRMIWN